MKAIGLSVQRKNKRKIINTKKPLRQGEEV